MAVSYKTMQKNRKLAEFAELESEVEEEPE